MASAVQRRMDKDKINSEDMQKLKTNPTNQDVYCYIVIFIRLIMISPSLFDDTTGMSVDGTCASPHARA